MTFDPVVSGNDELNGKHFSIENSYFIFELLRNKIYQDPISAICREICCNARDANRAAGIPNEPIKVKLPNFNSLTFEVEDSGYGISPDTIENVFIKYAASTKRNDNGQTGGFGLGAKTPFAYSDSFTVITVNDGIKYQYLCYIDETKIGKISLIVSSKTTDPSGTKIIVPVKSVDIDVFKGKFLNIIKYWEIKPNCDIKTPYINKCYSSDDFFFTETFHRSGSLFALIDDICYPILNINNSFNKDLYIKFDNRELSLTPSRENLHLDNVTLEKIQKKIKEVRSKFIEEVQKEVSNEDNFLNAFFKAKKYYSYSYSKLTNFKWNNYDIPVDSAFYTSETIYSVSLSKTRRNNVSGGSYFYIDKPIYLNDINLNFEQIKKSIKKISNALTNVDSIQIIPNNFFDKFKSIPVDSLKIEKLSSIISVPRERKTNSIIIYSIKDITSRISKQHFKDDKNEKVFCYLDEKKNITSKFRVNYSLLSKITNNSFYGIINPTDSEKEYIDEEYIYLDDFISQMILDEKENIENYIKNQNKYSNLNLSGYIFSHRINKIKSEMKTSNIYIDRMYSLLNNEIKIDEKMEILKKFYFKLGNEIEIIEDKKIANELNELESNFLKDYPMLKWIDNYYFDETKIKDIARYIDNGPK